MPERTWMTAAPHPRLRPFVDRYLGYRLRGFPPAVHRGLPSRHMTFIASIGAPIHVVAQTDPRQAPARYHCVVSGLQARPAAIAHDGDQEGIAVELTPLGSRALLGIPARELWDTSVELADVVGGPGPELWERLQGTMSWEERFRICDMVLIRLAGDDRAAPELERTWEVLVASGGRVAIGDLTREVGFSRQHLGRRFRDEFGLSPKLAARVIRFDRARRMLEQDPERPVAEVALSAGYYDQAHLHRDFAHLGGCTPRQILHDVPSVQDGSTATEAQWSP